MQIGVLHSVVVNPDSDSHYDLGSKKRENLSLLMTCYFYARFGTKQRPTFCVFQL